MAQRIPAHPRCFRRPHARVTVVAIVATLVSAALLMGCQGKTTPASRADALKGEALGLVVDSIVVPPFERGPGVQVNPQDLNLFRDQFEQQLVTPQRKAYPAPPTTLPNTVTLAGTLNAYEVREQTGDGMFLRSIDMAMTLTVRIDGEKEPALRLYREYSYQKLYLTTQGVAPLEFDLHNAAREATGTFVATLAPGKTESPRLESAVDAPSGYDYSHPWLVHGNRAAGFERYDRAIGYWSLVLYDPVRLDDSDEYRVSERAVSRLRQDGASEKDLAALAPLTRRGSESLEDVRDRVVEALGPNSPLESKVLQYSDESTDRTQINLSRAHYNLSSVYAYLRRYDVAAFHLSRAYGYDPKPSYLDAWASLQMQRNVIPNLLQGRPADQLTWMRAYQRVPAPFTATVSSSAYDRNVMPALAFSPALSPVPAPVPAAPMAMPAAMPVPETPITNPRAQPAKRPSPYPRIYGQPAPQNQAPQSPRRLGY